MGAKIIIPYGYESAIRMLDGRTMKKIGHNTTLVYGGSDRVDIVYHQTSIVVLYADGRVVIDHGGWQTSTTKSRLSQAMQTLGLGAIAQRKGSWYFVFPGGQELPYVNKQTFRVKGSY